MLDEYEVVTYRPEFRRQILQLQTYLWNPDTAVNSAHLRWKHENNPYLEEPRIYLVLHKGKVVAMRGFCGAKWEVGERGHRIVAPSSGDLVIAPDHRGCVDYCVGCGGEGHGRKNDFVARLQFDGRQGEVKSCRTRVHGGDVGASDVLSEVSLEPCHLGAGSDPS